jgi:hypothetical protein
MNAMNLFYIIAAGTFVGHVFALMLDRTYNEILLRKNQKIWQKEEDGTME